jgi:D-alanyl-D-alanine carboxypeptidase/D-alanyl-D-alanine-endopeptidase (penicillin-binding protein 4)
MYISYKLNLTGKLGCWVRVLLAAVLVMLIATESAAANFEALSALIGKNDSIAIADPAGQIVYAKNENVGRIPASILKVFTSLVALHYLGPDYRYVTEFYIDNESNLIIKGYGDPLLVSEVVADISLKLALKLNTVIKLNNLVLDNSHFDQPLTIPGITSSSQPYDAPNGALCVNFNTVNFKHTANGYISAEPQTPLLPLALKRIKASKMKQGRIVFSHKNNEITMYAGSLFQYFLEQNGIEFNGRMSIGRVDPNHDRLILRYVSRYSVKQIISKMLEFSNNFTTNQLFITAGTRASNPPGTLNKGIAAAISYAVEVLHLEGMILFEGSGISRKNRVSAAQMITILDHFVPHRTLMRREGNEYYKTGTLHGINTRAGYVRNQNGQLYRYVVIINTPGRSTRPLMKKLRQILH